MTDLFGCNDVVVLNSTINRIFGLKYQVEEFSEIQQ